MKMEKETDQAHHDHFARVREQLPDEEVLYDLAELYKIFGDTTRVKLLYILFEGEMCVQHLAELPARVAVQVGGEDALLGLVPVEDVVDADVQTALTSQNFCDSHTYSSLKCKCC